MEKNKKYNNAAIFYTIEDFKTNRRNLMGRHSAGESFLQGYARYSGVNCLYCYAHEENAFKIFTKSVSNWASYKKPSYHWIKSPIDKNLIDVGCLFIPDPGIGKFSWLRRVGDSRAYSICGITHTISSMGSVNLIGDILLAPTQPWDALICTSRGVKQSVENMLEEWSEYLKKRFAAKRPIIHPRLPIIPIGINTGLFDYKNKHAELRTKWRQKLGIGKDDIVFIFVGRLSFHAKAHPTPMYVALERAQKVTKKAIHLIQAGWFANDYIEQAFKISAAALCPSVRNIFVDGRDLEVRREIWAAADIFTSLSDNIQETFGITPIEAMAANLPVVIADWDGYRETVRDGIEGFTIPTLIPGPGYGKDFADRYHIGEDDYDLYIGNVSKAISVDIAACTRAYITLIQNSELRKKMAAAGKQRAKNIYDWKNVIATYQNLWQELAEIRKSAKESVPRKFEQPVYPLLNDPFVTFASYPTTTIKPEDKITIAVRDPLEYLQIFRSTPLHNFGFSVSKKILIDTIRVLKRESPCTVKHLLSLVTKSEHISAMRALAEFAKIGMITIGAHNIKVMF